MLTMFFWDLYLQIEVQIFRKYTDTSLAIVNRLGYRKSGLKPLHLQQHLLQFKILLLGKFKWIPSLQS